MSKLGSLGARLHRGEREQRKDKDAVDETITEEIVTSLSDPDVYRAVIPEDGGAELEAVRSQLAAKRVELAELEAAPRPSGARAKVALLAVFDELEGEIAGLDEREAKLTPGPSPLAELIDHGPDMTKRWESKPVEAQRQIAAPAAYAGPAGLAEAGLVAARARAALGRVAGVVVVGRGEPASARREVFALPPAHLLAVAVVLLHPGPA